MRRVILAVVSGGGLVLLIECLNHLRIATFETFILLLPGIFVACMSPDAACNPEGDLHPPGIVALILLRVINIVFYSGILYLASWAWRRLKSSR
jgi:hypothetical protein